MQVRLQRALTQVAVLNELIDSTCIHPLAYTKMYCVHGAQSDHVWTKPNGQGQWANFCHTCGEELGCGKAGNLVKVSEFGVPDSM